MPIKPENKGRYPANWPEIRQRVLKRAKNRCEGCGVKNKAFGYRTPQSDVWIGINTKRMIGKSPMVVWLELIGFRCIKIVLTVAHLNHIPEDCRMENLRAWCQRCHNRYDIEHRKQTRRANLPRLKEMPG